MKNANSKAKKPRIKENIRQAIKDIHIIEPELTGKEVKARLEKMQKQQPDKYQGRIPSLRTVQKILTEPKAVEGSPEFQELERPWSLDKTRDLSAEAIEAIIDVQKWAEKEHIETVHPTERFGITIRQALLVAQLHRVVKKYIGGGAEHLYRVSLTYAAYEILCTLTGIDFDTWELDRALRKGDAEFRLLIWNMLGDDTAFKAIFQLEMASQPIKQRKMRSIKEIAEEAGHQVEQLRSERERENQ